MEEQLEKVLKSLTSFEISQIWETFCEEFAPEESIYNMTSSELDDKLKYYEPSEIIEMTKGPNFNGDNKYWAFDRYSDGRDKLVSSNSYQALVDFDMLINHIKDTGEDFNNRKIKDILKGIK